MPGMIMDTDKTTKYNFISYKPVLVAEDGTIIDIGDTVMCLVPIDGLTYLKSYFIKGFRGEENRIAIVNDFGVEGHYDTKRFAVRAEWS